MTKTEFKDFIIRVDRILNIYDRTHSNDFGKLLEVITGDDLTTLFCTEEIKEINKNCNKSIQSKLFDCPATCRGCKIKKLCNCGDDYFELINEDELVDNVATRIKIDEILSGYKHILNPVKIREI